MATLKYSIWILRVENCSMEQPIRFSATLNDEEKCTEPITCSHTKKCLSWRLKSEDILKVNRNSNSVKLVMWQQVGAKKWVQVGWIVLDTRSAKLNAGQAPHQQNCPWYPITGTGRSSAHSPKLQVFHSLAEELGDSTPYTERLVSTTKTERDLANSIEQAQLAGAQPPSMTTTTNIRCQNEGVLDPSGPPALAGANCTQGADKGLLTLEFSNLKFGNLNPKGVCIFRLALPSCFSQRQVSKEIDAAEAQKDATGLSFLLTSTDSTLFSKPQPSPPDGVISIQMDVASELGAENTLIGELHLDDTVVTEPFFRKDVRLTTKANQTQGGSDKDEPFVHLLIKGWGWAVRNGEQQLQGSQDRVDHIDLNVARSTTNADEHSGGHSKSWTTAKEPSSTLREQTEPTDEEYAVALEMELWKKVEQQKWLEHMKQIENERLRLLESAWHNREKAYVIETRKALQDIQNHKAKLSTLIKTVHEREKNLVSAQENIIWQKQDLERSAARVAEESRLAVQRVREEASFKLELETKRRTGEAQKLECGSCLTHRIRLEAEERVSELKTQMSTITTSLATLESEFREYKQNQRVSPTEKELMNELATLRSSVEAERLNSNAHSVARQRLREEVDRLVEELNYRTEQEQRQNLRCKVEQVADKARPWLDAPANVSRNHESQADEYGRKEEIPTASKEITSEDAERLRLARERSQLLSAGYDIEDRVIVQLESKILDASKG